VYKIKLSFLLIILSSIFSCKHSKHPSIDERNEADSFKKLNQIKLGSQIWSTKNLDVEKFRNGEVIFEAQTDLEWKQAGKDGIPAWCRLYEDTVEDGEYGKLYNWYAVSDPRGLAPQGWHVPSKEEWEILVNYLDGDSKTGYYLKCKYGWDNNKNGIDSVGFNALPEGSRGLYGGFLSYGQFAYLWSSTTSNHIYTNSAYSVGMSYFGDEFQIGRMRYAEDGLSVRCLKD
jgi:uncharacterized protein (TIGR02145 family)